ncbi:hypothetical protein Nans01_04750 [Nocardiopsis ansamitocini]|uniref:Uncharacterized protein n=1 Tax=Nocardiopsis ansamitocini TaxID=1670832 RepID=A0A9W6P2N1_9ACTN|nr:hypothetical protein Nans01_04750 [Nocardiopsis ansamitocini]
MTVAAAVPEPSPTTGAEPDPLKVLSDFDPVQDNRIAAGRTLSHTCRGQRRGVATAARTVRKAAKSPGPQPVYPVACPVTPKDRSPAVKTKLWVAGTAIVGFLAVSAAMGYISMGG